MEFKMKTEAAKLETFHVDRMTDTAHKVSLGPAIRAKIRRYL